VGCFVRVDARPKISVQSVGGAPRQQDAQDERGHSRRKDFSPPDLSTTPAPRNWFAA
jgi:hypothetical protein